MAANSLTSHNADFELDSLSKSLYNEYTVTVVVSLASISSRIYREVFRAEN